VITPQLQVGLDRRRITALTLPARCCAPAPAADIDRSPARGLLLLSIDGTDDTEPMLTATIRFG